MLRFEEPIPYKAVEFDVSAWLVQLVLHSILFSAEASVTSPHVF
jgi:hypothetical protein